MVLSDISVKRPVFATVISLMLVAFGILSFYTLPLREFPNISPPIVSVSVIYPGASAQIVETKVTQILEDQIGGIEGIRSMRSTSEDGRAAISIEFTLERNMDEAANDVRDRVARVLARLPDEAEPPMIAKVDADAQVIQWFTLNSTVLDGMELTDYAERYVMDQLAVVDGVASIQLGGTGRFAMRIWLDPIALAARGLTVTDVEDALGRQNVDLPAGRVESTEREFTVRVERGFVTAEDFARMVVKRGEDGHLVRLGEVAQVEIGRENYRSEFRGNGISTIGLGIVKQSTANTLEVLRTTNKRADEIDATLPEGMQLYPSFDGSVFIEAAINSVYETLGIAVALVTLVIYLFLGTLRAALVPAVTVPVCLVSAFILLAAFGYSVNLLTLLALVLAIGLVVDDSIVVLENIYRRVEEGEPPLLASFNGARQVAFAVIATTLVLISVFVPIAFLEGNIGRVFAELAVTIGGAVGFSSLIALSLSPMMCSKLLKRERRHNWLNRAMDGMFARLAESYRRALDASLPHPLLMGLGMLAVTGGIAGLLRAVPAEFAPEEDQGSFFTMVMGPEGASYEYMVSQMRLLEADAMPLVETGEIQRVLLGVPAFGSADSVNRGVIITTMAAWDERDRSTQEVMRELAGKWNSHPGVMAFPQIRNGLVSGGGGGGQPVQFVLGGSTYEELRVWRDIVLARARDNPGLVRVDADYKETKPRFVISIDHDRAAELGVSIQNIGRTLQTLMSARDVTTFIDDGEEYDVMLQASPEKRRSSDDLANIYVRSDTTGALIPLSNLTTIQNRADAGSLNRFNRLRAVTISAGLAPGYTLGEALAFLEDVAADELPEHAQIDYNGESREYKDSSGALYFAFGLALLVVFLVLAAQFESFIHPIIIMLTVPLAVGGALLGLYLTDQTLNVFSEIGIIILIGIAAKNGILIVEFANQLRDQGREFSDAIKEASAIRLRPVIMTALSTLMGSVPLILATGAGAGSRITLGITVFSGVFFATGLTLFVVPVFYHLLGRYTRSPGAVAQELAMLDARSPGE